MTLGHGAMSRVINPPVTRQQMREAAGLAAAHRVRLASQGKRASGTPDGAGGEMEIDNREILLRTAGRLVGAHAPHRERTLRMAKQRGGFGDPFGRDTAY